MGPFVVVSTFSLEYREFAVNWYHTIRTHGRVKDVVVAVFDERSLIACMTLGLPCFNGSTIGTATTLDTTFSYGGPAYMRITWARVFMLREALRRNYSALSSDMDSVWFKDAFATMVLAADTHDADFVAMNDLDAGKPNCGNMFFRSNPRTRQLMDAWYGVAFDLQTNDIKPGADKAHDQDGLHTIQGTAYQPCNSSESCRAVKRTGRPALWLYPWHGCPWDHCHGQIFFNDTFCGNKFANLHIFCTGGGADHKCTLAKNLGMWHVDKEALQPHMRGAKAVDLVHQEIENREPECLNDNITHFPCPNRIGWLGL